MSRKVNLFRKQPDYLLDLFTGAAAGYSFRKLKSTSTVCCRIRRSSDNAETNIGFSGNDFDSTTALSFAGVGSAFVTTWYDQSGNGLNLTQTAAANQPRIILSGVLDTLLGFAAMKQDGVNDFLLQGDVFNPVSGNLFTASVAEIGNDTNRFLYGKNIFLAVANRYSFGYGLSSTFGGSNGIKSYVVNSANVIVQATDTTVYSGGHLWTVQIDSSNNTVWVDNTQTAQTAIGAALGNNANLFTMGAYRSNGSLPNNGYISEVIIFQADKNADRAAIGTQINNYYGIF